MFELSLLFKKESAACGQDRNPVQFARHPRVPHLASLALNIQGSDYNVIIRWIIEMKPLIFCVAAVGVANRKKEQNNEGL